jgi:signal transduction histidine kinase
MPQAPDYHQRLAEISLLYEFGQSFSAVLDLAELLGRICESALTLTLAAEAVISLVDEEHDSVTLAARRTSASGAASPCADEAVLSAVSRVLDDNLPSFFNPGEKGGLSVDRPQLHIPLHSQQRTIGVLSVINLPTGAPFAPRHLELLIGLGGYAAIAIENARLYRQAVERSLELGLLVESSNAVSSSLDLGRVLNAIARHMMRGLGAHCCSISRWHPQKNSCEQLAEFGQGVWPRGAGPRFTELDRPYHYEFLERRQAHALQLSQRTDDEQQRIYLQSCGRRRMMLLPLQSGSRVIGLAELSSVHVEEAFTSIQIGRTFRTTFHIAALIEAGMLDSEPSRLQDAARTMLSNADADWCTIYLWDAAACQLSYALAYGSSITIEPPGPRIDVQNMENLRIVLREQRIAVLRPNSSTLSDAERALFHGTGDSTMLLLPLVIKGETIGLIQLFDLNPDREFSTRELGLARALASQAAVAMENAALVSDLQGSLEEQRIMQSQLIRATRLSALGELAAVVAHQINNPLTTILGDAELIVEDTLEGTPVHESAHAILRAGYRAKKVVESMLSMTRSDSDAVVQDTNRTILDTLELVGPHIRKQHITLDVDLAQAELPVMAVTGQLEDVWMNLLLNAYDAVTALNADGRITIRSEQSEDGAMVIVRIEDNGSGIPPDQIARVFDPFFTTKPRGKGTGLGLHICRQIVRDHQGQIAIESAPGEGTCVTVRLPAAPPTGNRDA